MDRRGWGVNTAMTVGELFRLLRADIRSMGFSTMVKNTLLNGGVHNLADLVTMDREQLYMLGRIGRTSVNQIEKKLESLGLWLGMDLPEDWNAVEIDSDATPTAMFDGASFRDKIAMEVLRSVLSDTDEIVDAAITASYCYGIANAMLAARQKFVDGGDG